MAVRRLNNNFNVVSSNLKKYRKMRKLSQAGLARELELLGLSINKNDISLIEANKKTVKDFEIFAFKEALEISFEELYKGTKEIFESYN